LANPIKLILAKLGFSAAKLPSLVKINRGAGPGPL
jgi:hypothetical protein